MMEFYQACYGKPDGQRWSGYHANIPMSRGAWKENFEEAAAACTSQNVGRGGSRPDDLYELLVLDDTAFVFRLKYMSGASSGIEGADDREFFLAHGYLFDSREIMRTPALLPAVADENFHFMPAETEVPPQELVFDPVLTAAQAREAAGLDQERLSALVACVYDRMDSGSSGALYIRCGDRKRMKAMITCILLALPRPLRRKIGFSNADSISGITVGVRIYFMADVPNGELYFDPDTGSTNVRIDDIVSDPDYYPALQKLRQLSDEEFAQYSEEIADIYEQLAFTDEPAPGHIALAGMIVDGTAPLEGRPAEEQWAYFTLLLQMLKKWRIIGGCSEELVTKLLEYFDEKELVAEKKAFKLLDDYCDNAQTEALLKVYRSTAIRTLDIRDAASVTAFLETRYADNAEKFLDWYTDFCALEETEEITKAFCAEKLAAAADYAALTAVWDRLGGPDDLRMPALESLSNIVRKLFTPDAAVTADFASQLDQLREVCEKCFGEKGEKAYEHEYDCLCDVFREALTPEKFAFSPEASANYRLMAGSGEAEWVTLLLGLYEKTESYRLGALSARDVFEEASRIDGITADESRPDVLRKEDRAVLIHRMQEYIHEELAPKEGGHMLACWCALAVCGDNNPASVMCGWELPVFCDQALFREEAEELTPEAISLLDTSCKEAIQQMKQSGNKVPAAIKDAAKCISRLTEDQDDASGGGAKILQNLQRFNPFSGRGKRNRKEGEP